MTANDRPELDIELGTPGGSKGKRQQTVESVFSDYKSVMRAAVENDWPFKSNKSFDYGKIDQSHLTHINHGVQTLLTLYESLSDDHFFVDEKTLRETIALYVVHDYHKLRNDEFGDEEFDITKSEARMFMEKVNVEEIADVDVDAARSVMSAHHMSSDEAKKNEIPFDYIDEFYFVMLADSTASVETLEDGLSSSLRTRVQKAVNHSHSVYGHSIARDMGEFGNVVNKAMMQIMSDMGFIPLKPFSDGCIYIQPGDVSLDFDRLNERLLERVREYAGKARDDYVLEDAKSAPMEISDNNSRFYELGFKDLLFRGLEGTIEGVIQQSVADSRVIRVSDGSDKDETYCVTSQSKSMIEVVEEHVDVDIHTETRRVEGLAQGIHTIHRQFSSFLAGMPAESDTEWMNDDLMVTLKLFGLYNNPECREQVKTLRENAGDNMESGKWWAYKYLIGQFVYDKYCTGMKPNELAAQLRDVVLDNLRAFGNTESLEEEMIGDITSELASWLGINVLLHPESGTETKVANYRESDQLVEKYIADPDKDDCAVCSWGTTANKSYLNHDEQLLIDVEEESDTADIETNITGAGERETVSIDDHDTAICFACQIRINLNRANNKYWGEDEVLYAHLQTEYGYNPVSAWLFKKFMSDVRNDNTGQLTIDSVRETVVNNDVPASFDGLLSWDKPEMVSSLVSIEDAYETDVPFGGHAIPIAGPGLDADAVRDAIGGLVAACVYSGVRVHVSTCPMSVVEYNTGQLVSMSDRVSLAFPSFGDHITIDDADALLNEVATVEGDVECTITPTQ